MKNGVDFFPNCPVCALCKYNGRMYLHDGFVVCPNCGHGPRYDPEYHTPAIEGGEVYLKSSRKRA